MIRFLLFSALLLAHMNVRAQDLIWNNYPDGSLSHTFLNVGDPAVNVGVGVSGNTSALAFREPNGRPLGLRLAADYSTSGNSVTVTIIFSQPVNNLSFSLYDIDFTDGDSRYQDLVVVNGTNAGSTVSPTIGTTSTNTVTGNSILGINSTDMMGENTVSFTGPVNQITIQYIAGPAFIDPETQEIYIGNFNWDADVLPVRLVDFGGITVDHQVRLGWQTSYEQNSDYFTIERSRDARAFEAIGRVSSKGFSERLQTYGFSDPAPLKGTNYYRLRQVDRDGTYAYSKIVAVSYDAEGFYFQVVVLDQGRLQVETNAPDPVFGLVDVRGLPSLRQVEQVGANRYILHTASAGLATSGLKIVQMRTGHFAYSKKVLIM
ncbi:hypothetical protein LX87_00433 [Larkinella arboricola]|uniref:Uncharacterized protein n=1 Tax=Larkinella arboricola TaxID=643671 RepID=A0A327X8V1_LARAB|nr:hypothetical protein [Larkinella arboricola]RAK02313.1 hypothetical protein LX87_00433 [Larkinella arboricola]